MHCAVVPSLGSALSRGEGGGVEMLGTTVRASRSLVVFLSSSLMRDVDYD